MSGAEDEGLYMDIDGPEFLLELNQEIASLRSMPLSVTAFDRNALESLDQIATSAESLRSSLDMQKEIRAVILDTNFLLSNLQYLGHLGQCVDACSDPNSFKIVIPWMVVQELDRIKERQGTVAEQAMRALRYLEDKLRKQKPWLRVQKMTELHDPEFYKRSGKGDDAILDCCLYFVNNLKYRTLLLSNDRNLNIKAMAHEVQSLSRETVGALNQLLQSVGGKESLEMNRIYHSDEKFRQKMDIKEKTKNIAANLDIEIPKELTDMQSMEMDSNPDISQHAPLSLSNSSVHSSTIKPNVSSSSTLYDTYNHSSVQENTSLSLNPVSESTSLDEDTEMINYDEYQNTLEHSDSFKSKHAPKNQKILIPPSSADEHRKLFENRRNVTHKWRSTDESIWAPTYAFK
ncbi:hypothetical protein VTP01DRAFT_6061 [Rhizomucor pusillus]|uniref:uncharacterized protein n=1 Tax=Rhizomucor pusillus TaxID=4840 RepID=UPI003743B350